MASWGWFLFTVTMHFFVILCFAPVEVFAAVISQDIKDTWLMP
jgi:hypothetical protein